MPIKKSVQNVIPVSVNDNKESSLSKNKNRSFFKEVLLVKVKSFFSKKDDVVENTYKKQLSTKTVKQDVSLVSYNKQDNYNESLDELNANSETLSDISDTESCDVTDHVLESSGMDMENPQGISSHVKDLVKKDNKQTKKSKSKEDLSRRSYIIRDWAVNKDYLPHGSKIYMNRFNNEAKTDFQRVNLDEFKDYAFMCQFYSESVDHLEEVASKNEPAEYLCKEMKCRVESSEHMSQIVDQVINLIEPIVNKDNVIEEKKLELKSGDGLESEVLGSRNNNASADIMEMSYRLMSRVVENTKEAMKPSEEINDLGLLKAWKNEFNNRDDTHKKSKQRREEYLLSGKDRKPSIVNSSAQDTSSSISSNDLKVPQSTMMTQTLENKVENDKGLDDDKIRNKKPKLAKSAMDSKKMMDDLNKIVKKYGVKIDYKTSGMPGKKQHVYAHKLKLDTVSLYRFLSKTDQLLDVVEAKKKIMQHASREEITGK